MAMYNNGFPITYPQYYPQQQFQYQQQNIQQNNQQLMTPPTIHAEIIQIGGDDEAAGFPVGAGQSQMMMTRDDSAIYIKTAYANGQSSIAKYVREKAKPQQDPSANYITREEFEKRISEILKVRDEENE